MTHCIARLTLAALGFSFWCHDVTAGPIYIAETVNLFNTRERLVDSSPVSSNQALSQGTGGGVLNGATSATAGEGFVGAFTFGSVQALPGGISMDANASASASAFMDDLIVTAVSGSTLTTVDGSINLHLSGLMATGTGGIYGDGPDEGAKAVSRGEVLWSLTAQSSVGAFVNSGQCFQENILGEGAFSTCDSSVGPSGYLTIPMLFPVGEAFSLYLSLSVRGSAEATSSRLNSADAFWNVSYGNTFGFSEDRLAFELPAGFTANSLQAGIVDNRWDDPSTSNPTPVPEPATGILMASGMALAWIRRKRSVRH